MVRDYSKSVFTLFMSLFCEFYSFFLTWALLPLCSRCCRHPAPWKPSSHHRQTWPSDPGSQRTSYDQKSQQLFTQRWEQIKRVTKGVFQTTGSEGRLPAKASRAFLMSSALRMLLIAILTGEDRRTKEKMERGGEKKDSEGTRLKISLRKSSETSGRHSHITLVTPWKWSRKPGHVRIRWWVTTWRSDN